MTRQRLNPRVEGGFSILLLVLVAFAIFYIILRAIEIPNAYTPDHLEKQIERTDLH